MISKFDTEEQYLDALDQAIEEHFTPLMHSRGFVGQGVAYRRHVGVAIQCISLWPMRLGPTGCVSVGLHYDFLPAQDGTALPPLNEIAPEACSFRWTLWPNDTDYGHIVHMTMDDVRDMVSLVGQEVIAIAEPEFARLQSPADLAGTLEVDVIEDLLPGKWRWHIGNGELGLVMARIHAHLGNPEIACQWAKAGRRWAWGRHPCLQALNYFLNANCQSI